MISGEDSVIIFGAAEINSDLNSRTFDENFLNLSLIFAASLFYKLRMLSLIGPRAFSLTSTRAILEFSRSTR
jgi:hypothetical protein